jgi:S1-C subfamily serine protease
VLLWRDRKEQTVEMTITEWPAAAAQFDRAGPPVVIPGDVDRDDLDRPLGLTMSAINDAEASSEDPLPEKTGVKVSAVAPRSLAAEAGIEVSDILLRVGSDPVTTPTQVTAGFERAKQQNVDILLILLLRNERPRWVPMRMQPR